MTGYLNQLFDVEGKVAALTGAGGYLVGAISRGLGRAGVKVAVLDNDLGAAEKVSKQIVDAGGVAIPIQIDVRKKEAFEHALAEILDRLGSLEFVLNGAGVNAPTPYFDISLEEWHNILDIQLTGVMLGCQVLGRHMVNNRRGSIVNISSASSGPPLSKAFTYSVAKAGVKNLSQNLAREWAPFNVRVNILRPGFLPTEWNRANFITAEREQAILTHTPMRRYGDPDELVGAVVWLFSNAASFVTGAEIAVDGGFTAMTV